MAAAVFNPRGDLGATCWVRIGVCTRIRMVLHHPTTLACTSILGPCNVHRGSTTCQVATSTSTLHIYHGCSTFQIQGSFLSYVGHVWAFGAIRMVLYQPTLACTSMLGPLWCYCGTCMGVCSRKDSIASTHSCLHIHVESMQCVQRPQPRVKLPLPPQTSTYIMAAAVPSSRGDFGTTC